MKRSSKAVAALSLALLIAFAAACGGSSSYDGTYVCKTVEAMGMELNADQLGAEIENFTIVMSGSKMTVNFNGTSEEGVVSISGGAFTLEQSGQKITGKFDGNKLDISMTIEGISMTLHLVKK